MSVKKNYLRLILRSLLAIIWLTVMPILFLLGRLLNVKSHTKLIPLFHRGCCYILGLRVQFFGDIHDLPPTLYVSNHISYLDVFVLGGIDAYFIAKSEVASWPVLGPFAKLQNTLFFERKAGRAKYQQQVMQQHLRERKNLILFPEGTSTSGAGIEPFKSSLFESANIDDDHRVAIQPITLAYTEYDGHKITEQVRDYYAWYADMPFGSHLLNLLKLKNVTVKAHFHPVVYLNEFETRKQCADHCQSVVAKQLASFLQQ